MNAYEHPISSLFTIKQLTVTEDQFSASVSFNPEHPVFGGHFPGQPVVPGVVLVEIAVAVASRAAGLDLAMKEASSMKFLNMIDPEVNPVLRIEGSLIKNEDEMYKSNVRIYTEDTDFAKFKGIVLTATVK